jgi:hypothetical protein
MENSGFIEIISSLEFFAILHNAQKISQELTIKMFC